MISPLDGAHDVPEDRYCDLVMKGGITSGVIYPPAICELAANYRLKNIGGTSAGAIAAALSAAAEYRRRNSPTGSMDGFRPVEQLPHDLGTTDASGTARLLRLFQPDPACRRLFKILIASLNARGTFRRIGAVLVGCIVAYWFASLTCAVLSAFIWIGMHSIHAALYFLAMSLPTIVGLYIYFDITRNVVGNNYGLCKGMTTNADAGDALTPWLHKMIQECAGLPPGKPLTFGDLWDAPGGPAAVPNNSQRARSIDLRMFTTSLSHGRPYIFPHTEPTARLFYRPSELAAYLPEDVMNWINQNALEYVPSPRSPKSDPKVERAIELGLKEIPPPDKFPILLAARMSLSFPLLFAVVPLWAIDYEYPQGERDFERCLFSDGGISSNFPMHLFDGLIPRWPTFGIVLEAKLPGHEKMTFLPEKYLGGIADRWTRFDQETNNATRMGGFLMSIMSAMQNWNDNTLSRMAGVRDRVVRVRLDKSEGGMNLNMPKDRIDLIASRGGEAARELVAHFLGPTPADGWSAWSRQRWVRLDVFISALTQKIAGMQRALEPGVPHSRSYDDLITQSKVSAPPGHDIALNADQSLALRRLVESLTQVASAFDASAPNYPNDPLPQPDLRVRPML